MTDQAVGWRPIAEAPKFDGPFLLWNGREIVIGWWETSREFPGSDHFNDWSSGDAPGPSGYDCGFQRVHNVTHFMPLPTPPSEDVES